MAAVELAGRYAYPGGLSVQIIDGAVIDSVRNDHNYVWRETHDVQIPPAGTYLGASRLYRKTRPQR